ncbi:MAG TPA: SWIM zinc finger family protein [Vicinamibacteria bacterium]|nr:SWIM zinc finger family protein [Vicinamibacteria bacterium]
MADDRDRPWWRDRYGESTRPKEARGGIKAHSRRGAFGQSWWARRWLDVLERLELGGRLTRGRAYARRGQVLDIKVEEGCVGASVQGSRDEPYSVTIRVHALSPADWRKVADSLRRQARFAAKLLASEMPEDVEDAFKGTGVSLFPARRAELATECSCPDWANPCKHIAAVYYLLGEEFDRDPFLIFQLRGLSREGLVALLRAPEPEAKPKKTRARSSPAARPEPLPADPAVFWGGGEVPPLPEVRAPEQAAALLRRLGPFSFWRGKTPMTAELDPLYERAAAKALDVFVGGSK